MEDTKCWRGESNNPAKPLEDDAVNLYAIGGGLVLGAIGAFVYHSGSTVGDEEFKIAEVPPSAANEAADGTKMKLTGSITCDRPIKAQFSQVDCVWLRTILEQEERHTDSKGNSSTSWRVVSDQTSSVPFSVSDQTGSVKVNLSGGSVDAQKVYSSLVNAGMGAIKVGPVSLGGGLPQRVTEWAIPTSGNLFIVGMVQKSAKDYVFANTPQVHLFCSYRSEKDYLASLSSKSSMEKYGGFALVAIGLALIIAGIAFIA